MINNPIQTLEEKAAEKSKRKISRVLVKIVALNIVNALLIVAIFYVLSQLPVEGKKIKELRSTQIAANESNDAAVLLAEVDRNKDKINELKALFADDSGFLRFVSEADSLKAEGIITELSFPGGVPVRNEDKELGLPVLIVLQGTKEQINTGLEKVLSLPFFLKPVSVELETTPELLIMRFGAFLFVNEDFSKN